MHIAPGLKVLYFGTPVVLISSRNPDGSTNLAPMSSAWWLGQTAVLGLGESARTTANLRRERECVLNLASSDMAAAVDRIAMTTGAWPVPPRKAAQGYRHEPDKFAAGRLTEQPSELVKPSRVAQCPIQLECRLVADHPIGEPSPWGAAFHVEVLRAHVEQDLLIPGTHYVDPLRWDPLIMKFCEFFGGGVNVHTSRLAEGWRMPHHLPTTSARSTAGDFTDV
jgi:flavin reductase (DIM6/NTAB) family NADH-FMN oxidoreductase RutF